MPTYIYQHPKKKKVVEVVQTMTEPHEYFDSEGLQWKRVFTVPQGAVSTNIDPFSTQAYIDKIGSTKGSYGDAVDRSAELSERRAAQAGGVDPVKANYLDEYAKKHKGKRHPKEQKEKIDKAIFTV